ncbi:MAG: ribonuclease D [Candidatus Nitrohelix vancouverensis]|uniref:Ribonuclease D n=1 Tax=Candidatus Nitrohelix vancouverensis TaxID=2705534 RepID=A0A7T0C3C4_9BACT|nr:MAG: ribonuclease D [Candidatus Nitrohelix vancouverensis]
MYITTDEQLKELCDTLRGSEMLALDTEFVRERTYFHRLGLIQVANDEVSAAIDPITINDLEPFLEIIKDPKVLKVFHAARQDLEIFYRLCGMAVRPVFDTQIAAALVGWGSQISFAKIVHKVSKKHICKAHRYTDWCRRPLSEGQIEYALDDVRYLGPVYKRLNSLMNKMDRKEWIVGEFQCLEDPKNFQPSDPNKQFLKLKNIRSFKPRALSVLRELAAWRELEARSRDCLAKSIIRDETLIELARSAPKTMEGLRSLRGFYQKEAARSGKVILETIERGLNVPDSECPRLPESDGYTAPRGLEEILAAGVQVRAEEMKIEANVLADRKQIHDFVKCFERNQDLEEHFLFQSWRKECIGETLASLLHGRTALVIGQDRKAQLMKVESNGIHSE